MHPFNDLVVPDNSVGIQWFGQSTFGLKHPDGTIIQVDPYYPHERPSETFVHPLPPLDESTLRTNYVLLTHDHGDHTCIESLERIHAAYPEVKFIGPPESVKRMSEAGLPESSMTTVTAGDVAEMGTCTAHTVWAKPPAGIPDDDIAPPDVQHLGYVVDLSGVRVYVSGDPVNTFADHDELLSPIKRLSPHVGLLTNHPNEGEFPYFDGMSRIAVAIGLDTVVPAHYGCFTGRNYDPAEWASHLPKDGPKPLIIGYNQSAVYSPA